MPGTVLIVDDDAAMTDNLMDILGDEGYSPFCAGTCAEALALVSAHRPQIALLDLKLPDGTGINLLTRIKQIHPDCICALMTAYADLESAVAALEKGAFHYLQKPVRPAELLNLLVRSLEIIQIREEKRTAEERLRESEERFRTIIESAQDAIFLKDSGLRYTLVNPVMEKLFGIDATTFIGRTNEELFGVNEAALTRPAEQRVLEGEIVEEDELWPISGKQRTFHSIKVPMTDRTGAVTGLCGFTRDMTLTRNLEAQLLQAQKMEAIGILAGGVSHDFNNLLQAILGYTQILMVGKSSTDPQLSKLREIERAARRATELTSQLLAFSRKAEIHPRPVNLNDVVYQVKKLLERTIPKMIDIQLRLTEPILTVNADPGQLEQVLLNIGVNARDAMPEGGCLTFETANVRPPHAFCQIHLDANIRDYVLLSVSDTGHGMSTEVLQHMFEPFFTTKQPGQGTGLGMAMAYGLIKNHHGHVTCESLPGQGTTFNIYLPAIEVSVAPRQELPEPPLQIGRGETLLVVDDELFLRELARDMLSMNGYQVLMAESGEAGLDLYRKNMNSIDLVVLDLIMPGMGGKQCLVEILKLNPRAKVLIASGFAMDEPTTNAILSKTCGFIQKPYNFSKMLQLVRQVITHVPPGAYRP